MQLSVVFSLIFLGFLALPVRAEAGFLSDMVCWLLPCTGSGSEHYTRPYLEDGKIPQNTEYSKDDWTPEDWIDETHKPHDVVGGFYRAGIITDQSTSFFRGIPRVEVGQRFMELGGLEKRRVIRFVDYVAGYTKVNPDATVMIYHKASGDKIGYYNAEGLILQ